MKIIAFVKNSTAAEAGLQIGDDLVNINGHPIRDEIDFEFHASDKFIKIEIVRNDKPHIFEIEKEYDDSLGIIFEETKYRCCGNQCVFCFIDQNPKGLRESLYFKDEDFRLSFIYGNYVTLTNVSKADLKRIVEQRLSPLYVSIHSTDLVIRKFMLGIKKDDHLLEKIRFLCDQRIELHAQIVLCPAINDGTNLTKTIDELAEFYPQLKSIAIVPVGLTKYRQNLNQLQPVTTAYSKSLIYKVEKIAHQLKEKWDDYFVYLADEFYLLAGKELPTAERYDEFPQIENGVGMTRDFMDRLEEQTSHFPHRIKTRLKLTLVSGVLAAPIISCWLIPRLNEIENLVAEVQVVKNEFYGDSITVTGLLTGQDIYHQLLNEKIGDIILLPANCINYDGIFLDDWTPAMLQSHLERPVEIVDNDFITLIHKLDTGY